MIVHKINKITQLTAMIFTGVVLIELLTGKQLNNQFLYEILLSAFGAAVIKRSLFQGILFDSSFFKQAVYLIAVWVYCILCNYLFNWGLTIEGIASILAIVIILYIAIRLLTYQFDKAEVKKMNERLEKKEDKKIHSKSPK
ncbi:DUF3021 family protein [Clostridium sp. E02]|uniref:DUF3021 family protein n=1 Tax=Clostridium sp. E02 TaxID=2487134 RepID=UPI000F52EF1F|nr:DUF3021 family protein [Clostridium sp. E02]